VTPATRSRPARAKRAVSARTINVKTASSPAHRYDVLIGKSILHRALDGLTTPGRPILIIADDRLFHHTVRPLFTAAKAASCKPTLAFVRATEANKTLATLDRLLQAAAAARLERSDLIVAIGGGIVTDLAGFAAATYRRGVRVVHCPTTLLAMVDASVGGKTGVNIELPASGSRSPVLLKNMAGAFHQPTRVVIDTDTLESLPLRQRRSGLAECLKHALIAGGLGDARLWSWTSDFIIEPWLLKHNELLELIERNVRVKARVVAGDERELASTRAGGRMLLNLGHTFAHAIETLPGLSWKVTGERAITRGPLLHGEAVALGLLAATRVSAQLKLCEPELIDDVRYAMMSLGVPISLRGLPKPNVILDRMRNDKKTTAGKLRLILPVRGKRAIVRDDVPTAAILRAIKAWND
jgi:3-dehydroquinate synthase